MDLPLSPILRTLLLTLLTVRLTLVFLFSLWVNLGSVACGCRPTSLRSRRTSALSQGVPKEVPGICEATTLRTENV